MKTLQFVFIFLACILNSLGSGVDIYLATGINSDPPYVYGDSKINSKLPGITIEILREIEKVISVKFHISKRPWSRVVRDVSDGTLNAGFHFSYKESRAPLMSYPIKNGERLPNVKYSISNRSYFSYKVKTTKAYWDGSKFRTKDTEKLSIGVIRGSSIIEKLKKMDVTVVEIKNDQQSMNLLRSGRIDFLVGLENMIDAKIKNLNKSNRSEIVKDGPSLVTKPYYITFSNKFYEKNKRLVWQIWNQISKIKKDGRLDKIFQSY